MNSLIERTLGAGLSRLGQSGMFNSEARGYIGMIGALMALASLWMPFVSVWHVGISYFDLLFAKESSFPVVTIMIFLAALFLYTARLQGLGFLTAVIYSIAFVLSNPSLFSEADIDFDTFVRADIGFYVMIIGLILMILSPFLWRVNEKIEILFPHQNTNVRGYVGIVGALMTLIGMFVPYIDFWFVEASLIDLLSYSTCAMFFVGLLLAVCCFFSKTGNKGGSILGVIFLIATFVLTFSGNDEIPTALNCLKAGFWVMLVGEILMILSSFVNRVNLKIDTLFQAPQSKTAE